MLNTASSEFPPRPAAAKPSLIGMSRAALGDALRAVGVADRQINMRTAQLWHWLYLRGATSFDEMTNVSKDMRSALAASFTISRPEIVTEQISADGTRK